MLVCRAGTLRTLVLASRGLVLTHVRDDVFLLMLRAGERGAAFAALADMASSLAAVGCQEGFEGYLGAIAAQVRGTAQHGAAPCSIAQHCFLWVCSLQCSPHA